MFGLEEPTQQHPKVKGALETNWVQTFKMQNLLRPRDTTMSKETIGVYKIERTYDSTPSRNSGCDKRYSATDL